MNAMKLIQNQQLNDKMEDVINKFSNKINIEKSNLYFLYDGRMIGQDEYEKTLIQIANKTDQSSNTLVILAYKKDDQENIHKSEDITILLIKVTKEVVNIKGKRRETFKEIFERVKEIINYDLNKYDYSYRNKKIDFKSLMKQHLKKIKNSMDQLYLLAIKAKYLLNLLMKNEVIELMNQMMKKNQKN